MKKLEELMFNIRKPLEFAINPDDNAVVAQQYTGDDFLKIEEGLQSRSRETVITSVLEQLNTKITSLVNDTFNDIKDSITLENIISPKHDNSLYYLLNDVISTDLYLNYFKSKLEGKSKTIPTTHNIDIAYDLLDAAVKSLGDLNDGYLSSLAYFIENDVEFLLLPKVRVNDSPIKTLNVVVLGDDPELLSILEELLSGLSTSINKDKGYSFDKLNDDLIKLIGMVCGEFQKAITKITNGSCTQQEFELEMKYLETLIGGVSELGEHIAKNISGMCNAITMGRSGNDNTKQALLEFISIGIPSRIREKHGYI